MARSRSGAWYTARPGHRCVRSGRVFAFTGPVHSHHHECPQLCACAHDCVSMIARAHECSAPARACVPMVVWWKTTSRSLPVIWFMRTLDCVHEPLCACHGTGAVNPCSPHTQPPPEVSQAGGYWRSRRQICVHFQCGAAQPNLRHTSTGCSAPVRTSESAPTGLCHAPPAEHCACPAHLPLSCVPCKAQSLPPRAALPRSGRPNSSLLNPYLCVCPRTAPAGLCAGGAQDRQRAV